MAALRRAGVVESTRGAHGGYALARAPEEISVLEALAALEDGVSLADCVDDPSVCERASLCAVREVFASGQHAMVQTLSAMSLRDLLVRQRELESANVGMFEI